MQQPGKLKHCLTASQSTRRYERTRLRTGKKKAAEQKSQTVPFRATSATPLHRSAIRSPPLKRDSDHRVLGPNSWPQWSEHSLRSLTRPAPFPQAKSRRPAFSPQIAISTLAPARRIDPWTSAPQGAAVVVALCGLGRFRHRWTLRYLPLHPPPPPPLRGKLNKMKLQAELQDRLRRSSAPSLSGQSHWPQHSSPNGRWPRSIGPLSPSYSSSSPWSSDEFFIPLASRSAFPSSHYHPIFINQITCTCKRSDKWPLLPLLHSSLILSL